VRSCGLRSGEARPVGDREGRSADRWPFGRLRPFRLRLTPSLMPPRSGASAVVPMPWQIWGHPRMKAARFGGVAGMVFVAAATLASVEASSSQSLPVTNVTPTSPRHG
jgi:hypothetical protein